MKAAQRPIHAVRPAKAAACLRPDIGLAGEQLPLIGTGQRTRRDTAEMTRSFPGTHGQVGPRMDVRRHRERPLEVGVPRIAHFDVAAQIRLPAAGPCPQSKGARRIGGRSRDQWIGKAVRGPAQLAWRLWPHRAAISARSLDDGGHCDLIGKLRPLF
ncbi:hypothetical protein D3C72_1745320 [compost metagenome]